MGYYSYSALYMLKPFSHSSLTYCVGSGTLILFSSGYRFAGEDNCLRSCLFECPIEADFFSAFAKGGLCENPCTGVEIEF